MFALRQLHSQFVVKVPEPITSFEGKTIIITGGNTGLGFEAAKYYLKLKASRVILACRSLEKADKAKLELEQSFPISGHIVETWQVDLSSYASVIQFYEKARSLPRLDVLLLNAGIMTKEYRVAEDNESTITVNRFSSSVISYLYTAQTTPLSSTPYNQVGVNQISPPRSPLRFKKKLEGFMGRTTEEGAISLVFATSFGKESHGKYVGNGRLLSESCFVTSKDGAVAGEKLWTQLSSKLEKIRPNVMQGF
ncbi:short-chain dehydrogenase reductase family [Botrytis cinerea]